MKTLNCPECKKGTLVERRGEYETVYTDREERAHPLKVPGVTWLQCDTCGEAVLDDEAMALIEAARRRAVGLLGPEEIRAFRLRLRKTQVAMSELLGIGEKTYCRWESGSYVQSEAYDRYLRLLIADEENVHLLQGIARAKERPESAEAFVEARTVFAYISDLPSVADRGRVFADLMRHGPFNMIQ